MRRRNLNYPATDTSAPPPLRHHNGQRGFTMIELIMVIVIMGILSAIAVGRFFDRKSFDAEEFAAQSKGMLRYAQKVAIAQNRPVYVRLDGAGVALCFAAATPCAAASRVLPAAGGNSGSSATLAACGNTTAWSCEANPLGVTSALTPAAASGFYFDAQGKPFAATDAYPSSSSAFATLSMAIAGDGMSRSVTVEQETGYVH